LKGSSTEIDNLINLTRTIRTVDFYRCVDLMGESDRICIMGSMASTCLANYFGYMLGKIFPEVDVLHGHGGKASTVCNRLSRDSLVFLIAFPRYPKLTVELGQLAVQKGAKIIGITNSPVSPVVPLATMTFLIPIGIISFVDAYAAQSPFSMPWSPNSASEIRMPPSNRSISSMNMFPGRGSSLSPVQRIQGSDLNCRNERTRLRHFFP